jgi:hypothetical protein
VFALLAWATPAGAQELLPTPFSPEQIRDATPPGLTVDLRSEAPGEPPGGTRFEFTEVGPERVVFRVTALDAEGSPTAAPRIRESTWAELTAHASFSAKLAVRRRVTFEGLGATHDGWLYTLRTAKDGHQEVHRFWFSDAHPGHPLRYEHEIDGKLALAQAMVRTEVVPPPDIVQPPP